MVSPINIVASCSQRKRKLATPIRLRDMNESSRWPRSARWWKQLSDSNSPTLPAADLYRGDHWAVARGLPRDAANSGFTSARLWVASAGYGLIPSSAPLRSYSATFALGTLDSVALDVSGPEAHRANQEWWRAISMLPGPEPKMPRTLYSLAAAHPSSPLLVIASPTYVVAMREDLLEAASVLDNQDHLIIVSSAMLPGVGTLEAHWITTDAKLQALVGGSRISLNARVARKIIQEARSSGLEARQLQQRYDRLRTRLPAIERLNRRPMRDPEVIAFIESSLRTEPSIAQTPLLRRLRDDGMQCEQRRFKRLYNQVRA